MYKHTYIHTYIHTQGISNKYVRSLTPYIHIYTHIHTYIHTYIHTQGISNKYVRSLTAEELEDVTDEEYETIFVEIQYPWCEL